MNMPMEENISNRAQLYERGWRRHSCFSVTAEFIELVKEQLHDAIISDIEAYPQAIMVVTMYDCGVISGDFVKEPWLDIVFAYPSDTVSSDFINGKNPRQLDFIISVDNVKTKYKALASAICHINRRILLKFSPCQNILLSEDDSLALKLWVMDRTGQDTWPNEFNAALNPRLKALKKFYKKFNEFLSALYVNIVSFDEKQKKYEIKVFLTIYTHKLRDFYKYIRTNYPDKIKSSSGNDDLLKVVSGDVINIFSNSVIISSDATNASNYAIEIMSESRAPIQIIRDYKRLSPYTLSLENDGVDIPVDRVK